MSKTSLDDGKSERKHLNWKQYLKDNKYSLDSLAFQKHRNEYETENL